GGSWKSAQLSFQASSSRIGISNGVLENAHRGRAAFSGGVDLHNWSYRSENAVSFNLTVQQMPVIDIQHLAETSYPLRGELSGHISLSGSQLSPSGDGLLQIKNAVVYDQPLQTLAADFQTQGQAIASKVHIGSDAGTAWVELTYVAKTKAYDLR